MRKFFKDAINEMFEDCTPLQVIKRIISMFLTICLIIVASGADSIGGGGTLLCIGIIIALWYFFNLNDAWAEDDTNEE